MHSLAGFRNAFPDIRVTVEDLVAEGDRVVVRWSFCGTQRGEVLGVAPTGRRVTVTGMIFYRISEGGISEYWGSWDRMGLLQQLDARRSRKRIAEANAPAQSSVGSSHL